MSRFCFALLLSAIVCTGAAAAPASVDSAAQLTDDCVYGSGQRAVDACSTTIENVRLWPDGGGALAAGVYANRGRAYADMHRKAAAMRDFAKAIELNPDNQLTYFLRALAYLNDFDQYDLAVEDFDTSERLDSTTNPDERIYVDRGVAWIDLAQYDKAIADFDKAARLDPKDAVASADHGMAEDIIGRHDLAIRDYGLALAKSPTLAWALAQRCLAKISNGSSPADAQADCDRALRMKQTDREHEVPVSDLLATRGLFFSLSGNLAASRRDCGSAHRADPSDTLALYVCGLAETNGGDTARGRADIASAKAQDVEPYNAALYASYAAPLPPATAGSGGAGRLALALIAQDPASAVGAPLHDLYNPSRTYAIERDLTLPGDIVEADYVEQSGRPMMELHLSQDAQRRLDADHDLVGRQLALVLDGRTVLAAATVQAPLTADVVLSGNFTSEQIDRLLAMIYPPSQAGFSMDDLMIALLAGAAVLIALGAILWRFRRSH